jgi:hypothetical protein
MNSHRSDGHSGTRFRRGHSRAAFVLVVGTAAGLLACEGSPASSGSQPDNVETVKGSLVITNSFGGASGHSLDYFQCAVEGGTCVASPSTYLAYGANGSFVFKESSATGVTTPCNNSSFGGDPIPGVAKACYRSNYTFLAAQNVATHGAGGVEIAYGAFGIFNFLAVNGNFTCNDATFGDPVPGYAKRCYLALPAYRVVAGEGDPITGLNNTPIAYGANGRFLYRTETGSFPCTYMAFGGDPAFGYGKSCYKMSTPFTTDEPNNFNDPSGSVVLFGSGLNGNFLSSGFSSGVPHPCTSASFAGDPDFGHTKHCYGAQ